MRKLTASDARQDFASIVSEAAYGHERIVVTKHGKPAVAIIPYEDLEKLLALEDKLDIHAAEAAERRAKAKGEKAIPWSKAKKALGL